MRVRDALLIKQGDGIVAFYMSKEDFTQFNECTRIFLTDYEKIRKTFAKALKLNGKALALLRGTQQIKSFSDGVDLFCDLGFYAAQAPRAILNSKKITDQEIISMAEKLRMISYYPKILEDVLIPSAMEEFQLTIKEVENSTVNQILKGEKKTNCKNNFILSTSNGKEDVYCIKDTSEILQKLNVKTRGDQKTLRGAIAFRGKASGIVRVINTHNYKTAFFEVGDILVSINSRPVFLSLIKKAGALVADEGGIGTHAAIISRELKKPCIIGTKIATQVLKDGDLVEVDANNGVVKIIKREKR